MHFFSPANVMRLLEVVRGEKSAKDVIATAMGVGRRIAKVPVLVGVCYGFVGNRMLHQRGREAEKLILEGALPHEVDKVLTDFGFPMGPFAMGDLAGLDVGWRIRKGKGVKSAAADRICELGASARDGAGTSATTRATGRPCDPEARRSSSTCDVDGITAADPGRGNPGAAAHPMVNGAQDLDERSHPGSAST